MTTYFIINYICIWRLSGLVPRGLQGSEFGVCYKLEPYRLTDLQSGSRAAFCSQKGLFGLSEFSVTCQLIVNAIKLSIFVISDIG